ncbi:mechanosensitive ion channel family protein [Halospeciosus flavus]|uniref:Mechanosensitive ion channel family protein n=1 Tax=Halospeciosus flavus TaxID=3032283 RepID=A0ABD5Z1T6_9EURY|nr:mechanosensitive ion channel family protein [Halospeciosus flavus]
MQTGNTTTSTTTSDIPGSDTAEWVDALFESVLGQTLGTLALLAVVVLLGLAVRWCGPRLKRHFDDLAVETVQALFVTVAAVVAATSVVALWGGATAFELAADALELGPRDAVAAVLTLAFLAGGYAVAHLAKRIVDRFAAQREALSQHHQEIAHHLVHLGVLVVVFLLVLAVWRVNVGSLLLGAGVLSVVLGLAARQTLGSVLAGFVVLFSRPFELGDWIVVGDDQGIVQDVTIVNTQIKTFDDEIVMIPNDIITSSKVINRSKLDRLRVSVDVGVDYDTDVERATELAEAAMQEVAADDVILEKPDPHVVLTEFGSSAVVLRCRFYIENPTSRGMWRAKTRVIGAVKERYEEAGITIPFPQRTLGAREEGAFSLAQRGEAVDVESGEGGESAGDSTGDSAGSDGGDAE